MNGVVKKKPTRLNINASEKQKPAQILTIRAQKIMCKRYIEPSVAVRARRKMQ